jgi:F-type H+-transporting ATPase subunit epsilon
VTDKVLLLDIVTPDRLLFEGEVAMVVAPAARGEVGILPLHAAFLSELNVGELRFKQEKGGKETQEYVAVSGGFMEVFEDRVTVITPAAEFAREIDIERAKKAREEAAAELKRQGGVDVDQAEAKLIRAESRLRIAKRISAK